jgi:peptidyl-prolyl cis-trans isomerase SurA
MTEKQTKKLILPRVASCVLIPAAFAAFALTGSLFAQTEQPSYPSFNAPQPALQIPPMPVTPAITPNGTVVEDVIARINDQVITRSEYEQAEKSLLEEAKRQGMTDAQYDAAQHNLLRDMIDQQILIAKGKELGIDGEAEMTRRLDEIRKQNHLSSMEALQKAAEAQGISFEDFKQSLRNNAITQQVVSQEVGRHIDMTHAQEEAYYEAHKNEFAVPEQVHLSEILIPTPNNATDAQVDQAKTKADAIEAKLRGGANFADLAKSSSGGPTASAGGDLGDFKRGTLGDVLEKATFPLKAGQFTEPIRTRQGYVILRVDTHQEAGVPPLDQVLNQVEEGLYMQDLQPALRAYLTKAREMFYYDVRPGFVDAGAPSHSRSDVFTAYKAPKPKKKTIKREREEAARAAQVQAELIAARQRVAEKNAERAAAAEANQQGTKRVSWHVKHTKIHREKIRYGQSPRNALPAAATATTTVDNGTLSGQAPGAAMALAPSTTTISSNGMTEAEDSDDLLAIQAKRPTRKTRFSEEEKVHKTNSLERKLKKVEVKANTHPVQADAQQVASEKEQGSALGLHGDMKVKKKKKHVKGEHKERYEEKPVKPVDNTPAPAPTANPALIETPQALQQQSAPSSTSSTGSNSQTSTSPQK